MGGNKLPNLKGCVCLVTGASRGIGRGVSLALGECGATVYLTGRTLKPKGDVKEGNMGGSLEETAAEVTARGGVAIPVAVDHTDDGQVVNLFSRIRREQKGRLDLLVNNAFAAAGYISSHRGVSYWKLEAGESVSSAWDIVNRVGLRNHYICATLATRMMLECRGELTSDSDGGENEPNDADSQRPGLIINISSLGGLRYLFNVPYGVGKAAMDRMAADMAHELREKKKSIAVLSLWPGIVKTEHMLQSAQDLNSLSTTIEKLDSECSHFDINLTAEEISKRLTSLNMNFQVESENEVSSRTGLQIKVLQNPLTINCSSYDAQTTVAFVEFQCDVVYPNISVHFNKLDLTYAIGGKMKYFISDQFQFEEEYLRATVRYKRLHRDGYKRKVFLDKISPTEPSGHPAQNQNHSILVQCNSWRSECLMAYGGLKRKAFQGLRKIACLSTKKN